jgi:hypothetical protein
VDNNGGIFPPRAESRQVWTPHHAQMTRPERFARMLPTITLGRWLLMGVGLVALSRCGVGMWASNNQAKACDVFFIGRKMLLRLEFKVEEPLAALHDAALAEAKSGNSPAVPEDRTRGSSLHLLKGASRRLLGFPDPSDVSRVGRGQQRLGVWPPRESRQQKAAEENDKPKRQPQSCYSAREPTSRWR